MRAIQDKCVEYDPERKLSIIVEYIAGKLTQTIDRLIALYRPESLVVGTRGQRSVMQAWAGAFGAPGVGSVSKCVPVLRLLFRRPSGLVDFVACGNRSSGPLSAQVLPQPLARPRDRHPPGKQGPEDDGETTRGPEARQTL